MPDKDRLLNAIEAAASTAYGSETDSALASSRTRSIERYLGRNFDPAPEGRSQVRDRTTYETVEWIKPSILRIFAGSDEVVKFDPVSEEDAPQAEQESDYVNHVVTQKNNWLLTLHDWFHNALVVKMGYLWPYWDTTRQVESEFYENLSDDAFALIANDSELDIVKHSERVDEEADKQQKAQYAQMMQQYQMQAQQAAMQGQQVPPPPPAPPTPMLHDIEIKRVRAEGQVKFHVLAPERCLVDVNTCNSTLENCNYFEFYDYKTIGQIRASGLKIDDDVSDESYDRNGRMDGREELARDLYNESQNLAWSEQKDPSMRIVRIRHIWIRHDYDDDGINELQYCIIVGREVLFQKETDEIEIGSITPTPLPHRHIGLSVADVVEDIEDINTAFTRQAIDNLFFSNNPRLAVSDNVNMSDLLDSRPGGIIRVDGQPPQEIMPVTVPDMFPSAVQALQFFDSRRMNRTGINAYFQGTDSNTLNKTASGVQTLTSSAAQRVELIARLFAPEVMKVFRIVHKLITQHGHKKQTLMLRNKWVTVNPSEWKRRYDLKLMVGLGTGSKEGLMQNLGNIFAAQMQTMPMGIAQPQNIYHTLTEMAKAGGAGNPMAFFTDPSTIQPPQQPPPPEVIAEQIKAQAAAQNKQADLQAGQQEQAGKMQFEQWKFEQELAFNKWKEEFNGQLKIAIEQMKLGGNKELKAMDLPDPAKEMEGEEMEKQMMQLVQALAESQKQTQDNMQQITEVMVGVTQAIAQAANAMAAPRQLVRDPKTGRAMGSVVQQQTVQ